MSPRVDRILRRVLVVVAIADVILFLNTSRPESLTSFSYDPVDFIVSYWYLFASLANLAVVGVRAVVPPGRYQLDADSDGGDRTVRGVTAAEDAPFQIQALSSAGDALHLP